MPVCDLELLKVAFLTVGLELPVFYLCGYRRMTELAAFSGVNIISNLLLNETLPGITETDWYWMQLAIGEILVVLLEFFLMEYIILTEHERLFRYLLLTNCFSLVVGLLIFY